jgi:methylmalonyl-CoA/ethylmalonyl-CoA epimerase
MFKIKKIDHVAVCVESLEKASHAWASALGAVAGEPEIVESQGTAVLPLTLGESTVELISPQGSESLARFLQRRGPSLHHIAVEVEGIDEALLALKALGVRLIDEVSRAGARGHKVAFVHPAATGGVLVELVEPTEHDATQ